MDGDVISPEEAIWTYLVDAPEQGEWEWQDHCEGLAGGILVALKAAGYSITRTSS